MTLSSRDMCAIATVQPKLDAARANGYLVSYAAAGQHSYELCDDLAEAKAAYQEPPRGWFSIGISPCVDGVPFANLDLALTFGRKLTQIHRPNDVVVVQ